MDIQLWHQKCLCNLACHVILRYVLIWSLDFKRNLILFREKNDIAIKNVKALLGVVASDLGGSDAPTLCYRWVHRKGSPLKMKKKRKNKYQIPFIDICGLASFGMRPSLIVLWSCSLLTFLNFSGDLTVYLCVVFSISYEHEPLVPFSSAVDESWKGGDS